MVVVSVKNCKEIQYDSNKWLISHVSAPVFANIWCAIHNIGKVFSTNKHSYTNMAASLNFKSKPNFHPPCHKSWLKSWYWPGLRRWNKKFTGVPRLIKSTSMLVIETGENGVILFISEPFQKHKMHNCVTPINVLRKLSIWCLIMLI